ESDSDCVKKAQDNLAQGSPITAHICYRQARGYHELSLADCFRLELGISVQCGLLGEFQEGVRARLVDKDVQPNWLSHSRDCVNISRSYRTNHLAQSLAHQAL
uniref:enoyl-CoA hydratase/isomerase family protein n=1 Tax=Vibrio vulnificus TaxID=672 RepID=UPI000506D650